MSRWNPSLLAVVFLGGVATSCEKLPPDAQQVIEQGRGRGKVLETIYQAVTKDPSLPAAPPCKPGPRKTLLLSRSELEAGFKKLDLDLLFKDGRRLETTPRWRAPPSSRRTSTHCCTPAM
jgi:hypothetical protein